jgi:HSP20 family protein
MQTTATEKKANEVQDRCEPAIRPRTDIREHDDHFVIEVELPGVATDKVDLQVEDDQLRLIATKSRPEDKTGYLHRERRLGTYCRSFRLGDSVDPDGINGKLSDGVLRIHIPKTDRAMPRKISVQ